MKELALISLSMVVLWALSGATIARCMALNEFPRVPRSTGPWG